jgi:hypothetical protein
VLNANSLITLLGLLEQAKAWLEARREDLAQVRAGLDRFADVPSLTAAEPGPVLDDASLIGLSGS